MQGGNVAQLVALSNYDGVVGVLPVGCPNGCEEQAIGIVYADGTVEIVCSDCGRRYRQGGGRFFPAH